MQGYLVSDKTWNGKVIWNAQGRAWLEDLLRRRHNEAELASFSPERQEQIRKLLAARNQRKT